MDEITIRKPFDAHVHLRTGQMLRLVLPYTSCVFPRAVVMGNLENDPVDNAKRMVAYRDDILKADPGFEPIMSVMLTRATSETVLDSAYRAGAKVLKFIPGTASTGGAEGLDLRDLPFLTHLLKMARDLGMIFACHFELTHADDGSEIAMEAQERKAIGFARKIIGDVPDLKLIVEHASSWEMMQFVWNAPDNVAATLTPHHALLTIRDVCDEKGNITNPLHFCKPIAKYHDDMYAVKQAMVSGSPKFFPGSDSAPWALNKKQGVKPAAGIFSAPVALPLLCEIFEGWGMLERLNDFTSVFGPKFYGLPVSEGTVTIKKEPWRVPIDLEGVPIFRGGQEIPWKVC